MADTEPNYSVTMSRAVYMIVEMLDQYYTETQEAYQSRNGNEVHEDDVRRSNEYMDDIDNWINYWAAKKLLDLPATSRQRYTMPELELPKRGESQNLFWYEHLMSFWEMREEVRKSQSRNQGQGLHPNDVERWKEYTQNRRDYFDAYVSKILPVDRPQSSSPEAHYVSDRTDYSPGADGPIAE